MTTTLDMALRYADDCLAVFPVPRGQKQPTIPWRRWQDRPPTEVELRAMFDGHPQNIAVIGGRASGNLVILDCDDAPTFAETGRRLAGLGIQTTTVETVRGGHFWLRTLQPVKTTKRGQLNMRGQGAYALAPPSVHPSGFIYRFANGAPIYKLPTLNALNWLQLEPAPPPAPNVPRLAWKLLHAEVAALARYDTRSEAEAAICASLYRAGLSFDDCLRLFRAHPGPGKFAELHERKSKEAVRYLSRTWYKVTAYLDANPSEAVKLARELRAWALSRPWSGRTGSSDRATYLAHLEIVQRCGRLEYQASCRELAERAGISWQAAANATNRLLKADLLRRTKEATATLAARYRLVEDVGNVSSLDTLSTPHVTECQIMRHSHDVFRWQGLNKAGVEILSALLAQEDWTARVKDLVEFTGRGRATVNRKLKAMLPLGLVEPVGRGTWRVVPGFDPTMLDQAAADLGVDGTGRRQRERHRNERTGHRLKLERMR